MASSIKKEQRFKRHFRIRKIVKGTPKRPRLSVFRSNTHIYAQIIDDINGKTLASASSKNLKLKNGGNIEAAQKVAIDLVKKAKALHIVAVVFDRGGFLYHGRVKALAEKAREEGLKF